MNNGSGPGLCSPGACGHPGEAVVGWRVEGELRLEQGQSSWEMERPRCRVGLQQSPLEPRLQTVLGPSGGLQTGCPHKVCPVTQPVTHVWLLPTVQGLAGWGSNSVVWNAQVFHDF